MVQPGVAASCHKYSTTYFPRKALSETSSPFWSGKVKSGALSLISIAMAASPGSAKLGSAKLGATKLYRTARWGVILAGLALVSVQMAGAQSVSGKKAIKGPRALGLVELAPSGKAHLVPIDIL